MYCCYKAALVHAACTAAAGYPDLSMIDVINAQSRAAGFSIFNNSLMRIGSSRLALPRCPLGAGL